MILYEAVSSYHLLCACVERMKNSSEKAVLLISEKRLRNYHNIDLLNALFEEIIPYALTYQLWHSDKKVTSYFCSLLKTSLPLEKKFDRIYCSCGHHAFGYFLAITNTPYIFCEDGAGLLSRPEILIELNKNDSTRKDFNSKALELGLYDGSNKNVIMRRCNLKAQTEGFSADNVEDFNVIEDLKSIGTEDREQIIRFFAGIDNIVVPPKATILLTQHFANLSILTFSEQVLIYQLAVDYFFEDSTLVIKPHPDDLMYYKQLFPEAEIIHERFPSEFMPFIFNNQPECVATISSTAIFNLRGHYPKVFELDTRYEKDYPFTHRYYAALRIAQNLGLNVVCYNANELLAQRLSETLGEYAPSVKNGLQKDDCPAMLLIDDVTLKGEDGRAEVLALLQNLDDDSCTVLINSKSDYCWYSYEHREIWEDIAPIVLKKTAFEPKSEDFYVSEQDEVLYIYSKNKEILKMAKETEIVKDLIHTGVRVESMKLDSKEERIKMLEGILAATEKRLLYYIEKENQEK